MQVFHNTFHADAILQHGFKDRGLHVAGTHFVQGVRVSDRLLDENEGQGGDIQLSLNVPDEVLKEFEVIEEGRRCRRVRSPCEADGVHPSIHDLAALLSEQRPEVHHSLCNRATLPFVHPQPFCRHQPSADGSASARPLAHGADAPPGRLCHSPAMRKIVWTDSNGRADLAMAHWARGSRRP